MNPTFPLCLIFHLVGFTHQTTQEPETFRKYNGECVMETPGFTYMDYWYYDDMEYDYGTKTIYNITHNMTLLNTLLNITLLDKQTTQIQIYEPENNKVEFTEKICLKWCKTKLKKDPTATVCRFSRKTPVCVSLMDAKVKKGDGQHGIICWDLQEKVNVVCLFH